MISNKTITFAAAAFATANGLSVQSRLRASAKADSIWDVPHGPFPDWPNDPLPDWPNDPFPDWPVVINPDYSGFGMTWDEADCYPEE